MIDESILNNVPENIIIYESLILAANKIRRYENIMCSVSGGSDSDILLDICCKLDNENKIKYVFFDTGLEYEATKRHLKFLEKKYNIKIEIEKAVKPIPLCCRQYGQPFLSKQVSEYIKRLQKHNFKWEDKPFEELLKEYPTCKVALKWWCNQWDKRKNGSESSFNINYHPFLKEFMILNPPKFSISNECCNHVKKYVAKRYKKQHDIGLSITGIRKAEGGVRSTAYSNCFTFNDKKSDEYRGIFWYKNSDKLEYETHYGIIHSDCYSIYGLKRTGCVGCPYGRDFEEELEVAQKYEPKLYKAVNKIFADTYAYTREYIMFRDLRKTQ